MTALISTTGMGIVTDKLGLTYSELLSGIYQSAYTLQGLASSFYNTVGTASTIFPDPTDIQQANDYYSDISSMYSSKSSTSALGLDASYQSNFSLSSNGLFYYISAVKSGFRNELTALDNRVVKYDTSGTYTSLVSYLTGASIQVSSLFANMYYLVRNIYLPVANVYSPTGVVLGTLSSGSFTAGNFPTVNGYTSPVPTQDSYGNKIYLGGCQVPLGFAPCHTIRARATAAISGTCNITATALNQNGVSSTWTGSLSNVALGATVTLTNSSGYYLNGPLTALTFSGTATTPSFVVETVSLR